MDSRATFALECVLARRPQPTELKRIIGLYEQQLARYAKDEKAAELLATSGLDAPPKEMKTPELAAWTIVGNVLLNLDETLTKE